MRIFPKINAAVVSSFALLLLMVGTDVAHATRDLIVPNANGVLRFSGTNGSLKGYFITPGAGGLVAPGRMILGPDGNLYIGDPGTQTIKRFDLNGNFIDNFVPSGTIVNPVSIKFGPDGKLYVLCCSTIKQIHRYNGNTGAYEGMVFNALTTQINNSHDFIFMPGTNDFLIASSLNSVARFNFTTGAFVSHYLNPSRSTGILNRPTSIIIGPDGNYWVTSSNGTNKITRFNITNGAIIDVAFYGPSATEGFHQQIFEDGYLFVAQESGNFIAAYECSAYGPPPSREISGSGNGKAGDGFAFAGGNGVLTDPRYLLFVDINDPPLVNAGADQPAAPGQIVTLTGTGSDPDGRPITYQWSQISGTPVLSGSLLASGSVNSASVGFIAPDSGGPLVFQLTVSDGVKSTSDTVVVTISGTPVGSSPVLTLQAATGITTQSATLQGSVNPVAGNAAYRFEYGTVTLNSSTARQIVSSSQSVSATITGLLPGQVYFYRIFAQNGVGSQFTTERSFTTLFEQREITVESPPSAELSDNSGELDLNKVINGRSGIARIVTIRNAGATELTLGPITKDGTNPGDFAVSTPATTTLSAGASVDFTVIFTPGALGVRTAALHIPSNDADEPSFDIALTGTGVTPPELWRFQNFGIITNTGNAADSADPDKDSLINLLERAFNLNPNQAALPILTASTGTSGLPLIRRTGQPPVFSIQYLRLKASANPGLVYAPQFTSALGAAWQNFSGTETVQSINTDWERVTVQEPASNQPARFGRVKVVSAE